MTDGIVTDLVSPVSYVVGDSLEFKLTVTAPQVGTYYILGALYDSNYNYLPSTLFGVLLPAGETYAYNSLVQASTWDLLVDEVQVIDCRFTFDRSSVLLGLFLLRLVGTEISWEDDVQEDSTTVILAGAAAEAELDLTSVVSLLVVAGMMGVMIKEV